MHTLFWNIIRLVTPSCLKTLWRAYYQSFLATVNVRIIRDAWQRKIVKITLCMYIFMYTCIYISSIYTQEENSSHEWQYNIAILVNSNNPQIFLDKDSLLTLCIYTYTYIYIFYAYTGGKFVPKLNDKIILQY